MKYDLSNEHQKEKASKYFWSLYSKGVKIELKKLSKPRSLNQNAYWHVLAGLVGIETGYSLEEEKLNIKRELGLVYIKNGEEYPESSTKWDMSKFSEVIDYTFKKGELAGLKMPTEKDYNNYWFELERQVENGQIY